MRTLKTGAKARRTLEVDDYTVVAFDRQRARIDAERRARGSGYTNHDLVFPKGRWDPSDQPRRYVARVREWLSATFNNREQSVSEDELTEADRPEDSVDSN